MKKIKVVMKNVVKKLAVIIFKNSAKSLSFYAKLC